MTDDENFAWQIESRLTSHGVYVTDFEEREDGYHVQYESMAAADGAIPHRELGRVVNVFLDVHPDDWSGARIDCEVTDLDGTVLAEWHVEADWLDALTDDDISEETFSERVVDTLVRVE
ncbi:MAG: hypothetical protein ABEI96_01540 [Haloarculaceae archaeon]